ncbi:predicted nucleic acid-binding protein [Aeropyrum pernix]|uniref:Predicted nucleic acid-binding protein n=2 Tax=Aeropyrum pernix TaxID=56636 RepID=A0A401H9J0_AERPX|nr:predicted nucleic acid-binding protein [Aeropyrum pernix]
MNSSVIIALAEINMANIISVLNIEIIVPHAVYEEVVTKGRSRPGSKELETLINQGKVKVLAPKNRALVEALHDPLGMGESEAIALAVEHGCMLALDDRIARSKAKSMNLKVIGTIGLLRLTYSKGLIGRDMLIQALRELKEHGFRISDKIINEVLKKLK